MSAKYKKFKKDYQNLLSLYNSHGELVEDLSRKQGLDPSMVNSLRKKFGDEKVGQYLAYKQTDTSLFDEFKAGLVSQLGGSVSDIKTLGLALTGNKEGAQQAYKEGEEFRAREGTSYSFKDVLSDPSHFGDYVSGAVGNVLGFMLPGALTGLATKGAIKAGGKLLSKTMGKEAVKDMVKKEVAEKVAEEEVKKGVLKNLAYNMVGTPERAASSLTMLGQTAGSIYGQQPEDQKSLARALIGGGVVTALEYGLGVNPAELPVLKKAFGGKVVENLAEAGTKPSIKKAIGSALKVGAEESFEEVVQTPVENLSVDGSFGTVEEYIEGAAAGFFGGLTLGGIGKGYSNYQEQRKAYEEQQKAQEEQDKLIQEQVDAVKKEEEAKSQSIYTKHSFVKGILNRYGLTVDDMLKDPEVSPKYLGFIKAISDDTATLSVVEKDRSPEEGFTEAEAKKIENLQKEIEGREALLDQLYMSPEENSQEIEKNLAIIDTAKATLEKLQTKKKQSDLQVTDEDGNVYSFRDIVENVFKKKEAKKQEILAEEQKKLKEEQQKTLNNIILNTYNKIMEKDGGSREKDADNVLTILELDRDNIVKRTPKKPMEGQGKNKTENQYLKYSLENLQGMLKEPLTEDESKKIQDAIAYKQDLKNKFHYVIKTEDGKVIKEVALNEFLTDKIKAYKELAESGGDSRPLDIKMSDTVKNKTTNEEAIQQAEAQQVSAEIETPDVEQTQLGVGGAETQLATTAEEVEPTTQETLSDTVVDSINSLGKVTTKKEAINLNKDLRKIRKGISNSDLGEKVDNAISSINNKIDNWKRSENKEKAVNNVLNKLKKDIQKISEETTVTKPTTTATAEKSAPVNQPVEKEPFTKPEAKEPASETGSRKIDIKVSPMKDSGEGKVDETSKKSEEVVTQEQELKKENKKSSTEQEDTKTPFRKGSTNKQDSERELEASVDNQKQKTEKVTEPASTTGFRPLGNISLKNPTVQQAVKKSEENEKKEKKTTRTLSRKVLQRPTVNVDIEQALTKKQDEQNTATIDLDVNMLRASKNIC